MSESVVQLFKNNQQSSLERPCHLFTLSAKNQAALLKLAESYQDFLKDHPPTALANICFSANTGRTHFDYRLAAIASSNEQLQKLLAAFAAGQPTTGLLSAQLPSHQQRPKIAFLFTGQGSQYVGMGRVLYETQPVFRKALEQCDTILRPYLETPLLEVLYPQEAEDNAKPLINETAYTQPALFALEYALAQLWRSWGIVPDAVIGHSVGEYVAACVAGVFSLEDGLKLIAERARLMQSLPQDGMMAAVFASEARVAAAIAQHSNKVAIATINGPENVVISGLKEAVQAILEQLKSEGITARSLQVSHAFHSPLMQPILDEFEQIASSVEFQAPQIPLVSNLTGQMFEAGEVPNETYWGRHLREAVRFSAGMETLCQQEYEVLIELGPSTTLIGMGQKCWPQGTATWLPSLKKGQDDWQQLLTSLSTLYIRGVSINWSGFDQDYRRQRLILPNYPFQHQSFWSTTSVRKEVVTVSQETAPQIAPQPMPIMSDAPTDWFYHWQWQPEAWVESREIPPGAVLIFKDDQKVGSKLGKLLDSDKYTTYLISPGQEFQKTKKRHYTINPSRFEDYEKLIEAIKQKGQTITGVIHLWHNSHAQVSELLQGSKARLIQESVYSVMFLGQALLKQCPAHPIEFLLGTQNAYATSPYAKVEGLHQSMATTLAQVLALENSTIQSKVVDITSPNSSPEALAALLLQEMKAKPSEEGIVAIRDGQRFVRTLARMELSSSQSLSLKAGETWLISGGTSAVGAEIALGLVRQTPVNLVLTGRQALPPRQEWENFTEQNSSIGERIRLIQQLERLGSTVMYEAVDVADAAGMQLLMSKIKAHFGSLHGVIHAAGVQDSTNFLLRQKQVETIAPVFAPKVQGTIILDAVTRNEPLRYFVVLSSAAASKGEWGTHLADYAAANAFLDSYATYRSQQAAPGKSLALNYSLWRDKGMTNIGGLPLLLAAKSKGINPLEPEQAVSAFMKALSVEGFPVIHLIDLKTSPPTPLLQGEGSKTSPPTPLLQGEGSKTSPPTPLLQGEGSKSNTPPFPGREGGPGGLGLPQETVLPPISLPQTQTQNLRHLVREILSQHLPIPPEQVQGDKTFPELGLDSLAAIEAIRQLGTTLQVDLSPTLLFEYQTPNELADYLEQRYGNVAKTSHTVTSSPAEVSAKPPEIEEQKEDTPVTTQEVQTQDIAIIGMACKVPGADNLDEYWNLLIEGRSAIEEVPESRWSSEDYFDKDGSAAHTTYCKRGGFVKGVFDFDPMFFGISPREATAMDPQQRLFLEVAWQALQQAGYGGRNRTKEIGVFVGCGLNSYSEHFTNYQYYEVLRRRLQQSAGFATLSPETRQQLLGTISGVMQPGEIFPETAPGNELNGIAARVSHCLDLTGPSLSVSTACSSSLVALHLACESLRSGQVRMAIVGGVNLNISATPFTFLSRVQALSSTGTCYPFDQRANGMILGEGTGALILKPLQQAIADGDIIHAVIKGSAINNDGHSQGITAPNPRGQAEAIRKAYTNFAIDPQTVSYVETHGTGTLLGDPIEVEGLTQAFRNFTDQRGFCGIGSVKSSIGHLLSASGIISLIKVVLSMQHGYIPPTLGFEQPNPHINFADTPFYVVGGKGMPWSSDGTLLRAGVNGFGFGGTNCHVILEQAPVVATVPSSNSPSLLCLSARNSQVLKEVAGQLREHILQHPEQEVSQICFTLNNSQKELSYKAAVVVDNRTSLLEYLEAIYLEQSRSDIYVGRANPQRVTPIYLVMDGNTAITPTEAESLGQSFPEFHCAYTNCINQWKRIASHSLHNDKIHSFAVQYALGRLLMALSLQPTSLLAEKTGILVGACLLGRLTLEEAITALARSEGEKIAVPLQDAKAKEPSASRWCCPLVTPSGVLRNPVQVSSLQIGVLAQSSEQLQAAHCQEYSGEGGVYWQLGGSSSLKERLGIGDEQWQLLESDKGQPLTNRLLASMAQLYVAGVRFNSTGLFPSGLRRVPLPTYPFERKTYTVSSVRADDDVPEMVTTERGLVPIDNLSPLSEEERQSSYHALLKVQSDRNGHQLVLTEPELVPMTTLSPLSQEERQSSYAALLKEFSKSTDKN